MFESMHDYNINAEDESKIGTVEYEYRNYYEGYKEYIDGGLYYFYHHNFMYRVSIIDDVYFLDDESNKNICYAIYKCVEINLKGHNINSLQDMNKIIGLIKEIYNGLNNKDKRLNILD